MHLSDLEALATFLEMGLDSLFLAQFSRRIEAEFGVSVTFGHLADELATAGTLSRHLDQKLPPDTTNDSLESGGGRLGVETVGASHAASIEARLREILTGLS